MKLPSFNPYLRTVSGLLNAAGTGYYIPLYQRPYRWKKRDVQRLISEIIDGVIRFQNAHTSSTLPQTSSTFLGTAILVQDRESCVPPPVKWPSTVYQVIDGQQRIATLMAICGELHKEIASQLGQLQPVDQDALKPIATRQSETLQASLHVRLYESGSESLPRMIRGKADTWGKTYTSTIARYLSGSNDDHNDPPNTESKLFDNCIKTIQNTFESSELFHERIASLDDNQWASLFSEQPPDQIPQSADATRLLRFLTFAAFMMNSVQIIAVEADNGTSASAVFEPLNTTGESLTAFETFVPLVVYNSGGDQQYNESPDSIQLSRFARFIADDYSIDVATRTKRALVTFALADTGTKLSQDPHEQRRYLRRYLSLDAPTKSIFLRGLGDTGDCLRELWYGTSLLSMMNRRQRTRVALAMLIDSKHTIPQALLVRAYRACLDASPDATNYEALYDLIETIADFWVLWRLSRSTTDNIDSHYRNLMAGHTFGVSPVGPYSERSQSPKKATPGNLVGDFSAIIRSEGEITDMRSWIDRVLQVSHGQQSNGTVLRYALLAAYNDTHAEAASPPYLSQTMPGVSSTLTVEWYEAALTIEHIAPRSQTANDGFADEIYSGGYLHGLGNLTLVPKKENSALGNKPWMEKRQYYRVFSQTDEEERAQQAEALALNPDTVDLLMSNYIPFCLDLARYSNRKRTWTPRDIQKRGEALAERIWKHCAPSIGF